MLDIEKVDHIGIRVSDRAVSVAFHEPPGFQTLSDTGFEQGHPTIMLHPPGVVLDMPGPGNRNIPDDVDEKYLGITRVSF